MICSEWARCRPWIEAALACAGGTHTIEDIEAGLIAGLFQFWPGNKAAAVTEIEVYPRLRVLNFFLLGGDLKELLQMAPTIEAWGRRHGCAKASGSGRSAWGRALERQSYKPKMTLFLKDLTDVQRR